jgi:hypothetical protein
MDTFCWERTPFESRQNGNSPEQENRIFEDDPTWNGFSERNI